MELKKSLEKFVEKEFDFYLEQTRVGKRCAWLKKGRGCTWLKENEQSKSANNSDDYS